MRASISNVCGCHLWSHYEKSGKVETSIPRGSGHEIEAWEGLILTCSCVSFQGVSFCMICYTFLSNKIGFSKISGLILRAFGDQKTLRKHSRKNNDFKSNCRISFGISARASAAHPGRGGNWEAGVAMGDSRASRRHLAQKSSPLSRQMQKVPKIGNFTMCF